MADLELVSVWALAVVFVVAAVGKLSARGSAIDFVIAVLELSLGALLVSGFEPAATRVVALAVSGSYAVYALTRPRNHRCNCFGEGLPTTGRGGQITRNSLMTTLAGATVALSIGAPSRAPGFLFIDGSLGLILGVTIVVGPWVWRWVAGNDTTLTGLA